MYLIMYIVVHCRLFSVFTAHGPQTQRQKILLTAQDSGRAQCLSAFMQPFIGQEAALGVVYPVRQSIRRLSQIFSK